MGIAKGALSLLCEFKKDFGVGGKVLQLGRQTVFVTADQLLEIFKKENLPQPLVHKDRPVSDVDLFLALGFSSVESMDLNAYEGAGHIHDLNEPVSEELKGQYDLVYDGGTVEHVFNFPQCLKNIFDLLKPGGVVIHAAPSHNHVDHGFYMFSPTVFSDYYAANKFDILRSYLVEYSPYHSGSWLIYNYVPGSIDHLSFGGWGRSLLAIFFVARKTEESTSDAIPQQSIYKRSQEIWDPQAAFAPRRLENPVKRMARFMLKLPGLSRYSGLLYSQYYRLTKRKPRVIRRY